MHSMIALGIDPGDARFGLAISDSLGVLAHPLETIPVKKSPPLQRIREIVSERNVTHAIIGLAKNMDGSHGPAAEKAEAFATALRTACPDLEVILQDERMSTMAAARSLREAGLSAREQKSKIDAAAATNILQTWLDARSGGLFPPTLGAP